MTVTVILCTYNRCRSLATALASVAAQILPEPVKWEVLVVDNNSSDQTPEVVADFDRQYPGRFRYLFEPQPGKSYALNAGIREASGEILVFTDDDVTVERDWLRNLTTSLHNGEWAGASGRTLPEASFVPPRWFPKEMRYALAPLAIFDLGPEACALKEAPYGNNMAFRRAAFLKYGGFRTDLGPCAGGTGPQKCEDSEFGTRLLAAGERLRYEPSAVVFHAVPKSRVQQRYFLEWWFDKARADIQAFGIPKDGKLHIAGIPAYLFRRLAVWTARWMLTFEPSRRFDSKLKVWTKVAEIVECHRRLNTRRRIKQLDAQT